MKSGKIFFLFAVPAMLLASCGNTNDENTNVEPAELQIWRSYSDSEIDQWIIPDLEKYATESEQTEQLSALHFNHTSIDAVIGYANVTDTAIVNKFVENAFESGALNKKKLHLAWGYSTDNNSMLELYALIPEFGGGAAMEGDIIKNAKANSERHQSGLYISQPIPDLSIELKDDAAKQFADLTDKNIYRTLPIVINGVVYCAPTVIDRIEGGILELTGAFSEEEAKQLAEMLNASRKQ